LALQKELGKAVLEMDWNTLEHSRDWYNHTKYKLCGRHLPTILVVKNLQFQHWAALPLYHIVCWIVHI